MSTFLVTCPCGSGHTVEARDAGFTACTITVQACSDCRSASGAVSYETRKSYGVEHYVPSASALMHRDGLVTFA
jgi:hypothetical protein